MSRIEQLITEIEEYIDSCKFQPLSTTKIIVNKEELDELLGELRLRIPDEIKQYQKIISNQEGYSFGRPFQGRRDVGRSDGPDQRAGKRA